MKAKQKKNEKKLICIEFFRMQAICSMPMKCNEKSAEFFIFFTYDWKCVSSRLQMMINSLCVQCKISQIQLLNVDLYYTLDTVRYEHISWAHVKLIVKIKFP